MFNEPFLKYVKENFGQELTIDKSRKETFEDVFGIGVNMLNLKPCPFCGGEAKVFAFNDGGICVKCMECYCQTQVRTDMCIADAQKHGSAFERCVEDWNKRYDESFSNTNTCSDR